MNFKFVAFFLVTAFFYSACGVKGPPIPPPETRTKEWEKKYTLTPPLIFTRSKVEDSLQSATQLNIELRKLLQQALLQHSHLKKLNNQKKNRSAISQKQIQLQEKCREINKTHDQLLLESQQLQKHWQEYDQLKDKEFDKAPIFFNSPLLQAQESKLKSSIENLFADLKNQQYTSSLECLINMEQ